MHRFLRMKKTVHQSRLSSPANLRKGRDEAHAHLCRHVVLVAPRSAIFNAFSHDVDGCVPSAWTLFTSPNINQTTYGETIITRFAQNRWFRTWFFFELDTFEENPVCIVANSVIVNSASRVLENYYNLFMF